ncbi:tetratricopeptide repeat protein [Nocardiopsis sp. CNT-189]|uniref:tetratricopeptide repeat protein n=1 Tax=Nocardiopsis oceanisediminis TaxID=2816862 RepID=UPI003B2ECFD9
MPDAPSSRNTVRGDLYGSLLQARDVHGDVHIHSAARSGPRADVCLDAPRPATRVRGRDRLLAALTGAMAGGDPRPQVLTGPGGIGKSTVAAELARRAAEQGRTVWWVRPGGVAASVLEAAVELGGDPDEAARLAGAPRRAARWAWNLLDAADRPWLLVFDNADRPEELDPDDRPGAGVGWLRGSPRGTVLVTTRTADPGTWAPAALHPVEPLAGADAAAVLADHAGAAAADGAAELAERLGGFPLALALAGRAMAAHPTLFPGFRELGGHLAASAVRIDDLVRPLGGRGPTLAGTLRASVRALSGTPQAEPLLDLLALLGAEGAEVPLRRLPVRLLRGGRADTGPGPLDEAAAARALNALAVHGLAAVVEVHGERALRLHPLIGETVRAGLGEGAAEAAEQAERLLRAAPDRDPAMEHAAHRAVAEVRAAALGEDHPDALAAALDRDRLLLVRGDPAAARRALAALAARAEQALGPEHPVALRARHLHGDALLQLGRLDEAEQVYRAEYEARGRLPGGGGAEALSALHQIALVAVRRGDLPAAAERFRAVLEQGAEPFGADHPVLLQARQNLAFTAIRLGERETAERELAEVVAVKERLHGPEHSEAVDARYYVALNELENGDAAAAVQGFAGVAQGWERTLGADHPRTRLARERLAQAEERAAREGAGRQG